MRMSGCPCLTRRRFRRDPTDALFAGQSQFILGQPNGIIGLELSACNGATEAARSVAVSNVSRPSSAKWSTLRPKSTRPDKEYPGTASWSSFEASLPRCGARFAVQQGATEQNTAVSAKRRIEFLSASTRVTTSSTTMTCFGDGVNIAARLEGLAEP